LTTTTEQRDNKDSIGLVVERLVCPLRLPQYLRNHHEQLQRRERDAATTTATTTRRRASHKRHRRDGCLIPLSFIIIPTFHFLLCATAATATAAAAVDLPPLF
jgi:hypothetical protein